MRVPANLKQWKKNSTQHQIKPGVASHTSESPALENKFNIYVDLRTARVSKS